MAWSSSIIVLCRVFKSWYCYNMNENAPRICYLFNTSFKFYMVKVASPQTKGGGFALDQSGPFWSSGRRSLNIMVLRIKKFLKIKDCSDMEKKSMSALDMAVIGLLQICKCGSLYSSYSSWSSGAVIPGSGIVKLYMIKELNFEKLKRK